MTERKIERAIPDYFEFNFSSNPFLPDHIRDYVNNDPSLDKHSFHYQAIYRRGNNLGVRPVATNTEGDLEILAPSDYRPPRTEYSEQSKHIAPQFPPIDPWDLFFKHASFDSILYGLRGEYVILSMPEYYETGIKELKEELRADEMERLGLLNPPLLGKSDTRLLSMVNNNPYLLYDKDLLKRFIEIIRSARWGLDKDKSGSVKYYLNRYFLPKHQGGKRPLPNVNLTLAVELVKKLSLHLSKQCINILGDPAFVMQDNIHAKEAWEDLRKWITESIEYRLSCLSDESLKTIILKPASFTKQLIEKSLNTSLKTFSRNMDN